MPDTVTLTGLIATTPRHLVTTEGLSITSFRLASNQRRFDRTQEKWIDGDTNWYTVTAFRQLAMNSAGSLAKGERILVTGRLRIREWESGDRAGTSVEIEADSLGHDLSWGTAAFTRSIKTTGADSGADLGADSGADVAFPSGANDAPSDGSSAPAAEVASEPGSDSDSDPDSDPDSASDGASDGASNSASGSAALLAASAPF
jgi:single-strand DNA-binding protein